MTFLLVLFAKNVDGSRSSAWGEVAVKANVPFNDPMAIRRAPQAATGAYEQRLRLVFSRRNIGRRVSHEGLSGFYRKLRKDAAEAALFRIWLRTGIKREMFNRLHEHLNRFANEVAL
jgi:hypothetical protein